MGQIEGAISCRNPPLFLPGLTALVAGCEAAPYLLFGLFSGALTDRWNRRRVMIVADLLGFDAMTFALSAALIAGIHRTMHHASRRHAPLTVACSWWSGPSPRRWS